MKKILCSFIILLALFSLAGFVVVPGNVEAQMAPCSQNYVYPGPALVSLEPCTINLEMVDGAGNKDFSFKIKDQNNGYFGVTGFEIEQPVGFPEYSILKNTSSGSLLSQTTLTFTANDSVFVSNANTSRTYRGSVNIHFFRGSSVPDGNNLTLYINVKVYPAGSTIPPKVTTNSAILGLVVEGTREDNVSGSNFTSDGWADWKWKLNLATNSDKAIRSILIYNNYGPGLYGPFDVWSTNSGSYPLLVVSGDYKSTAFNEIIPTNNIQNQVYYLYGPVGQVGNWTGGRMEIYFTDGTMVTGSLPASNVKPINTPSIKTITPVSASAGAQIALTGIFPQITSIHLTPNPTGGYFNISPVSSPDMVNISFTLPTIYSSYNGDVGVTVTDTNGQTSSPKTLRVIAVIPPPSITISSPFAGETLYENGNYVIKWDSSSVDTIFGIYLYRMFQGNPLLVRNISNGIDMPNVGLFDWDIKSSQNSVRDQYLIKIVGYSNKQQKQVEDYSDLFTISLVKTGPVSILTATTATLGGSFIGPDLVMTSRGFEYGLTTSYGKTTTESGAFRIGAFSTNISSLTCNTTYHFRAYVISTLYGLQLYGPDQIFTTSPCKTLTLTSNLNSSYKVGETIPIKWKSTGISTVKIDLMNAKGTNLVQKITTSTASTGQYDWIVQKNINFENDTIYTIRISDADQPTLYRNSRKIEITPPTGPATITVQSPNGGESYKIGEKMLIRWSSANLSSAESIKIGLTLGSKGAYFTTVPNTGSYEWTIPQVVNSIVSTNPTSIDLRNETQAVYRIAVVTVRTIPTSSLIDVSNDPFTITAPTLPSPILSSLSLSSCTQGSTFCRLEIKGSNFTSTGNTVKVGNTSVGINGSNAGQLTSNGDILVVDIPSSLTDGSYQITVSNSNGSSNSLPFTIIPTSSLPIITSVSPSSGPKGTVITLFGSNFDSSSANDIQFGSLTLTGTFVDSNHITFTVPQYNYTPGTVLNIYIVNDYGESVPAIFTVTGTSGTIFSPSSRSLSANVISAKTNTSPFTTENMVNSDKFYFTRFMEEGSRGTEVIELQKVLSKAGYDVGNADGVFGAKVKSALMQFQTANGLKVDGIIGYEVRTFLNR